MGRSLAETIIAEARPVGSTRRMRRKSVSCHAHCSFFQERIAMRVIVVIGLCAVVSAAVALGGEGPSKRLS
jgi:hypothetical protein